MAQPILKPSPISKPTPTLRKSSQPGQTNGMGATPKAARLPLLKELHPAYAMDKPNRKAYISVLVGVLHTELDDQVLQKAYLPTARKLISMMMGSLTLDGSYWQLRQLTRERDLAKQQNFGSEDEGLENEAERALRKFKSELFNKELGNATKALPTGSAWLRGKYKKAMLFLDCCCVLRDAGQPNIGPLIDAVAKKLDIHLDIVALVKAYVGVPDDPDLYHKACADIAALVKPAPLKKKIAAKKVPAKKAAAKKVTP